MNIEAQFKRVLKNKGLLSPNTGTELVWGIEGEDVLLQKWQKAANAFVYKGKKISVGMGVERLYFNESRVWPIIYPK